MDTNIKRFSLALLVFILIVFATYTLYQDKSTAPELDMTESSLVPPTASSTQSERTAYMNKVAYDAVKTNAVEITDCVPLPVVSAVNKGAELTFLNKDAISHEISFTPNHSYVIEASSSKTILADFGKMPGAYPFRCDSSKSIAGIVLISE